MIGLFPRQGTIGVDGIWLPVIDIPSQERELVTWWNVTRYELSIGQSIVQIIRPWRTGAHFLGQVLAHAAVSKLPNVIHGVRDFLQSLKIHAVLDPQRIKVAVIIRDVHERVTSASVHCVELFGVLRAIGMPRIHAQVS